MIDSKTVMQVSNYYMSDFQFDLTMYHPYQILNRLQLPCYVAPCTHSSGALAFLSFSYYFWGTEVFHSILYF